MTIIWPKPLKRGLKKPSWFVTDNVWDQNRCDWDTAYPYDGMTRISKIKVQRKTNTSIRDLFYGDWVFQKQPKLYN